MSKRIYEGLRHATKIDKSQTSISLPVYPHELT
jgi:hypothetical protein